jgi:hypothetical protein
MGNENGTKRGAEQVLQDLEAQVDPKGGHKAGGEKGPKYMVVKMDEVFVSSVETRPSSQV